MAEDNTQDEQRLLPYLREIDYFAVLDGAEQQRLVRSAVHHSYAVNQVIFLEGEEGQGLWVIEAGSVKITKLSPEGDEQILHLLGKGDVFNVVGALDGGPSPANAVALSPAHCWVIPCTVIREAIQAHPRMALQVIDTLTGRIRGLTHQIEDLTLYSVTARLARFLLKRGDNPSQRGPGVTRAAIAGYLATTPETVSRVLASLQEAGAIRFDRHRIVITDRAKLRSIAMV